MVKLTQDDSNSWRAAAPGCRFVTGHRFKTDPKLCSSPSLIALSTHSHLLRCLFFRSHKIFTYQFGN